MFHKALWIRSYKQTKIVIWLLWVVSLLTLPIPYLYQTTTMASRIGHSSDYWYFFSYHTSLLPLSALVILMGCLLIGLERTNQEMDFMFALPFRRRDLFIVKWLLGAVNIVSITLVNLMLMFLIHQGTIFSSTPSFSPFLTFFGLMVIALLSVYSLTLFIGSFTGGIIMQALLTIAFCFLPWLLSATIFLPFDYLPEWHDIFRHISPFFIIEHDFLFEQRGQIVHLSSNHPTFATFLSLSCYFIISLPLGMLLYEQTPGEKNGKIILYKSLEPIFIFIVMAIGGLFGGLISANILSSLGISELMRYYFGFILTAITIYFLLVKLMKKPLKYKRLST